MKRFICTAAMLFSVFTARLEALSSSTLPQQLTWLLQYSMELCLSEGAQLEEITLPMLTKHLNKDANTAFPRPFAEMFQMMRQDELIRPGLHQRLVAVISMSVVDSQHPEAGRYMLWWDGQHFHRTWETEAKANEMFREAGLVLVNRGTWKSSKTSIPQDKPTAQRSERSPEEQREWLIRTRIEDGHDFGKPKPTREEVIRQLEAEGLIEKKNSRWPVLLGLVVAALLLTFLWKMVSKRRVERRN